MKKIVYFLIIGLFSAAIPSAFATDFVDHKGYIPDWAKSKSYFNTQMTCIEVDWDSRDFEWCGEFNGYTLDKMIGSSNVTFKDTLGYIPDWAKTIGQNQASATCMNVDYLSRDTEWCYEFSIYVLKKLTGEIDESYTLPPTKEPSIPEPPPTQIPKTDVTDPLEKYLVDLDKINYGWNEDSDAHELSTDVSNSGISNFYARSYESTDGLDAFFVAITEFNVESQVEAGSNSFIKTMKEKISGYIISNREWVNADCEIVASPNKSTTAVSCTNQSFLITTISILKTDRDTDSFVEAILKSIDKEHPTVTTSYSDSSFDSYYDAITPPAPKTNTEVWPDSLIKSDDTRTIGVITNDDSTQKVFVNISTDKKSYQVGDDLEWTVRIQGPWQSGYNFGILDDNSDWYHDFYDVKIVNSDGSGSPAVEIYPGGDGLFVNYNSGSNTVRIENFWTDDMPYGEYNLSFQLELSGVMIDKYVNFEKNIVESLELKPQNPSEKIPNWVKNNAKWWADGAIDDDAFVSGIQFLIKEGILDIPESDGDFDESSEIPAWVKRVADFWSMDMISEDDFIMSIQFLIENGIVKVN